MRTLETSVRAPLAAVVLCALASAGSDTPASAATWTQSTALDAVSGQLIVAPRGDAHVKQLPARVAVRSPADATRARIRLNDRDVTARFRPAEGSRLVAELDRGDGLDFGPNGLVVLAERRGRPPVIDSRSFVLGRRAPDLVRLRMRPGPVTSLALRGDETGRGASRRERSVRLRLNGRAVTGALERSTTTRWRASLSASHGLRHGRNRLRIVVAEPETGRYEVLRRTIAIGRDQDLPGAGRDVDTQAETTVQLDGGRSRTSGGARPDFRWRIVSKPRGSHPHLRGASGARPRLSPDRPGRYVVGLRVNGVEDRVVVSAGPATLLVPFEALGADGGHPGIRVGDTFYPNPSPGGTALQWLTLNRTDLTPTGFGNTWLDGSGQGDHGLNKLREAVSTPAGHQLMILAFPFGQDPPPVIAADQVNTFNDLIKKLGVGPLFFGALINGDKLAIVGVPGGGEGSGWSAQSDQDGGLLGGWLMPDASKLYQYVPTRHAFDTSSSATATSNTMTVAGRTIESPPLPAGATGGFHVVAFHPAELTLQANRSYASNGTTHQLADMSRYLFDHTGMLFAVQSIGSVAPEGQPDFNDPSSFDWHALSTQLAASGANPHTFNTARGSYAFVGSATLDRSEVADSSSAVVVDPTLSPPKHETGTLQGRLGISPKGSWRPAIADPAESLELKLYDIVFRPATPWPFTEAAGLSKPEAEAYARALANITKRLPQLSAWVPDLRRAYVGAPKMNWGLNYEMLHDLHRRVCVEGETPEDVDFTLYSREQFCNLARELQTEFVWLDSIRTLFDGYADALNRSDLKQQADLHDIGEKIRLAVEPGKAEEITWSVFAFLGNLGSAAILAFNPEATSLLAAWEALVTAYELGRELDADESGLPVGDQVKSKVDDLSQKVADQLAGSADTMDRLRDVIASDFGRLQALGSVATGPEWSIDVPKTSEGLRAGGRAFFGSQLLPVPYGVHAVYSQSGDQVRFQIDKCDSFRFPNAWQGTPASAQVDWMGDFRRDSKRGWFPTKFVLGLHELSTFHTYPPAALSDVAFRPFSNYGWGLELPRFMWEQFDDPAVVEPLKNFPPTDIFQCE